MERVYRIEGHMMFMPSQFCFCGFMPSLGTKSAATFHSADAETSFGFYFVGLSCCIMHFVVYQCDTESHLAAKKSVASLLSDEIVH